LNEGGKFSLHALSPTNGSFEANSWCRIDEAFFEDCRRGIRKGLEEITYWTEAGTTRTEKTNFDNTKVMNISKSMMDNYDYEIESAPEYF